MTKFYYSIATKGNMSWEAEKQYFVEFATALEFGDFCQQLSNSQGIAIRGCKTEGYNNNGAYIHPQHSYSVTQ